MDDETLQLIEDCEKRSEKLTDWETGFIDSIRNQVSKGKILTMMQLQILDKIWDRVTGK